MLSDRRVELASPDVVRSYVADLHNLLAGSELVARRAFIRSFVKEVRVTGDEVVLAYTMPLMPDGSSVDRVGVLPIVQHGRPCRARTCDTLIRSKRHVGPSSTVRYLPSLFCLVVSGPSCLPEPCGVVPC